MRLHLLDAAPRLRRPLLTLAGAASVIALVAPVGAHAADSLGPGGVSIPGSALTVGVSGATGQVGKIQARFSAVGTPLFEGADPSNLNDDTAAVFALNTPSGLYSAQGRSSVDNQPFTPLSAPVLTGTGSVGDPYAVTSQFRATASIDITQTVTHVSGTSQFKATWAIHNGGGSTTAMQAFEGADLYVRGDDTGTGTKTGNAPSRVIGSVAADGTTAQIVEQSVAPFTHSFSGDSWQYYSATGDSTFGSFSDTIDPTVQDSAMGVEWDYNLGAGATKTVSVVWNFAAPSAPQAPRIVGGLPAQNATVNATSAAPSFAAASGDESHAASFECAIDGGAFAACTAPKSLSGLAEGEHTFSVRALNSAGVAGPQTDRTWKVDTTGPGIPTLTGAPTGRVNTDGASIALSGEPGATFRCAVDDGSFVTCSSPLVLTGLSDTEHVVEVRQVDAAGNPGSAVARASWTVDTTAPGAPVVLGAPGGIVAVDHASLDLSGENGATFRCSVDGGPFGPCANPFALTGLADGPHDVRVKQTDEAGNVSDASDPVSWTVDTSVPPAPPTSQPQDTTSTTADVAFTTPAGSTAECSLDDDPYQACTSPVSISGLAVGTHRLKVRMVNAAGTPGTPQVVTWEVKAPVVDTPALTADTPAATPATPAAAPAPTAAPAPNAIAPAPVCVSRRVVTVHWKLPKGAKAQGFTVLVGGKVVKRLAGKARAATVSLAGRTAGPVKVEIRTAGRGPVLSTTRVYRTCVRKSASTAGQPTMVLKRAR